MGQTSGSWFGRERHKVRGEERIFPNWEKKEDSTSKDTDINLTHFAKHLENREKKALGQVE